jgi:hypothetical protein
MKRRKKMPRTTETERRHKTMIIEEMMPQETEGKGIFSKMTTAPWAGTAAPEDLDLMFILERGERRPAPFLEHFYDEDAGQIPDDKIGVIAKLLLSRFNSQWEHLWKAYIAEYNPIYNVEEHTTETTNYGRTDTKKTTGGTTRTDDLAALTEYGRKDTRTDALQDKTTRDSTEDGTDDTTTTYGKTQTQTNYRNGFNGDSANPVLSDKATTEDGGSDRVITTHNAEINGTDTTSHTGTQKQEASGTDIIKNTGTQTTESHQDDSNIAGGSDTLQRDRSGNIGVTTSAQMITGEIELWKWDFFKQVFDNVCSVIASPLY